MKVKIKIVADQLPVRKGGGIVPDDRQKISSMGIKYLWKSTLIDLQIPRRHGSAALAGCKRVGATFIVMDLGASRGLHRIRDCRPAERATEHTDLGQSRVIGDDLLEGAAADAAFSSGF